MRIIYRALSDAAERGEMCPTSAALCAMAGLQSTGSIPKALEIMQRDGHITYESGAHARRVTIVATGKSTAQPPASCMRPHWNARRRNGEDANA